MDIPRTDDARARQLMHEFTVQSRRDDARQRELAWQWLRHHTQKMRNRDRTKALLDAHDRQEIARYERILGIDHEGDDAA